MIQLNKKRIYIWLHIFTWAFLSVLPWVLFGHAQSKSAEFLSRWYANVLLNAAVFYLYYCYINRRMLVRSRLIKYLVISVVIITGYTFARGLLLDVVFRRILDLSTPSLANLYFSSFFLNTFFVGLAIFLNFTENWFLTQQLKQEIEKEKLESELKMLRQQLNPHFLFNTLNNIHTLVYKKSDMASDAILKLSGLMRYMLYESEGDAVPLSKELNYIRNFVELQKLRLTNPGMVKINITGNEEGRSIAPLLLLPFIENAFKHASTTADSFIEISITVTVTTLLFSCRNSFRPGVNSDKTGGIGLQNVRKRLQLQYPGDHILVIRECDNIFDVNLTLSHKAL